MKRLTISSTPTVVGFLRPRNFSTFGPKNKIILLGGGSGPVCFNSAGFLGLPQSINSRRQSVLLKSTFYNGIDRSTNCCRFDGRHLHVSVCSSEDARIKKCTPSSLDDRRTDSTKHQKVGHSFSSAKEVGNSGDKQEHQHKKKLIYLFHFTPEKGEMEANRLIGTVLAMKEYGLRKEELEDIPSSHRQRSPYHGEPEILYYREEDVKNKAIKVHGSVRALEKFKIRQKSIYDNAVPLIHRLPKAEDAQQFVSEKRRLEKHESSIGSWRVVRWAIFANLTDFCAKGAGYVFTGSHSMFAEMIHSLADTLNQLLLGFGIKRSLKKPDKRHPYGYANVRHVTSLIAGVGILFVGTGLNFYHGISALMHLQPLESLFLAYLALTVSVFTQGTTLYKGWNELNHKAAKAKTTWKTFLKSGADPSLNVVILEDSAALLGVVIAASCMSLSSLLQNPIPDAVGSLIIGTLLGGVSYFVIRTNTNHLLTSSVPAHEQASMETHLENDPVIKSVHDVKATEMGLDSVRLKAEIDFDGRKIAEVYLSTQDLTQVLKDIKKLENEIQLQAYLMHFGDKVVDKLGEEVDRIEQDLKKKFPDLRHIDLEGL